MLHNDGDESASNHSVTQNGNPEITDTAKFGQAGYFDGNGDYLIIQDSADWDFGYGDFTIDFWINSNGVSSYEGVANSYDLGSGWQLGFSGSSQILRLSNNNFASTYLASGEISTNVWHHVSLVRTDTGATGMKFYIDGVLSSSASGNFDMHSDGAGLMIGRIGFG